AAMLPHWESPNSLLLWTRWQWQDIDGDPSTLFVNYNHQIDSLSSFGAGFLQHNTGVFVNTGGQLNYTRAFQLVDGIRLLAGMNIFVFQQNVADEQFLGPGQADPSLLKAYEGFRTEFSPGLQLLIDRCRLGIAFENAFGFKFSGEGERDYLQNITGSLSYDFPIEWLGGGQDGFLRPMAYFRTSPGVDTQVGLHALLRAPKFWVQGGYNSFYGVSGGLGVTLARTVSIGGLMEFAVDRDLEGKNPSIEILASYRFGKTGPGKKEVDPEKEQAQVLAQEEREQEAATKEMERARIQKEKDSLESIAQWQKTQHLLGERQRRD